MSSFGTTAGRGSGLIAALFLSAVGVAGCFRAEPPVRLTALPEAGTTRLILYVTGDARINARLKPALELSTGQVVRFDSPGVTPDSSYFTAPPEARLSYPTRRPHGKLRVGICPSGENLCQAIEIDI
ncbi:MAG: hypothetical protein AB7I33_09360 [Gemmatimonadales bacterium]